MNLSSGRSLRAQPAHSPAANAQLRHNRLGKGLVATALLAIVTTGCVTPSSSQADKPTGKTATTLPTLTADQAAIAPYVKQADAICEKARITMASNLGAFEVHKSVTGRAKRRTVKLAKPEQVALYVKGQFVHLEDQQKAIHALALPGGDSGKKIEALWTEAEAVMVKVKKDPEAAAYDDPFQDVAKSLKALGFSQCFQGSRPVEATPAA